MTQLCPIHEVVEDIDVVSDRETERARYLVTRLVTVFSVGNGDSNAGQIVGFVYGDPGKTGSAVHSFLFDGTSYTELEYPGATTTWARGINDGGQIVGDYTDSSGRHAFLFDGTSYSTLNYGTSYTDGFDINNAGQIVGDYFDGSYIPHAFLFNGTSYGDIIYPGARSTYVRGINNMGQAVGFYEDSSGKSHMFLATPLPVSNP